MISECYGDQTQWLGTLEFSVLWTQYNFDGYQQKTPLL